MSINGKGLPQLGEQIEDCGLQPHSLGHRNISGN